MRCTIAQSLVTAISKSRFHRLSTWRCCRYHLCASCPSFHPSTSPFSYPSTFPFFPIPEKFFKYMLHVVANKMQWKIFYRVPLVLSSSDDQSLKTHPVELNGK